MPRSQPPSPLFGARDSEPSSSGSLSDPESWSSSSSSSEDLDAQPLNGSLLAIERKAPTQSWHHSHPLGAVPRLALRLLWEMSGGPAWVLRLFRLVAFAVALAGAFRKCVRVYLRSPTIIKNVRYGPSQRNYLDVYLPPEVEDHERVPVVVFISGGAWIIGYKAWGLLAARCLNHFGYIVVTPDYRNYPQTTVEGMVTDLHHAMRWVFQEIHQYRGDPDNVSLCGQSAGAQLAMMVLFEQARQKAGVRDGTEPPGWDDMPRWPVERLTTVLGLSGPYHLPNLKANLQARGVHEAVTRRVFGGDEGMVYYSPELQARRRSFKAIVPFLPPITLFHGLRDVTVSHVSSLRFYEALREWDGVRATVKFYDDMTHSGPLVEDLMSAEPHPEDWVRDFVAVSRGAKLSHGPGRPRRKCYIPRSLAVAPWRMRCARWLNPF